MEKGKLTISRNHLHRMLSQKFTDILSLHPAGNLTGLSTALASGVFEVLNIPDEIECGE